MSDPWARRLAYGLLDGAVTLTALAVLLALASGAGPTEWVHVAGAVVQLGAGVLGLLLVRRDTRSAPGWLLLAASLGAAVSAFPMTVVEQLDLSSFGVVLLGTVGSLAAVSLFALVTLGVLLFPSGKATTRLGRVLVTTSYVALGFILLGAVTHPGWTLPGREEALPGSAGTVTEALGVLGLMLSVPITVLAAVDVRLRRRRSADDLRRGLRPFEVAAWLNALAGVVAGAVGSTGTIPPWLGAILGQIGVVLAGAAWLAIPHREELFALINLATYGERVDPVRALAELREQTEREAHRRMAEARDAERRRLRSDLHDGLGPTLAGIVLGIEGAERHLGDDQHVRADLAKLRESSRHAVEEVRRLVHALRPPVLDSLGLDGAIRQQAEFLGAASVDTSPLPPLPDGFETGVYFVAVEAMKNASAHADPGSFWVRLSATDRLLLEVHDDGPGVPDAYQPGVGIASMRERTAALGGTLQLLTRVPHGTVVRAEWPVPE